jgi:hypothetical protein
MFQYSSITTHGVLTAEGEKIKETHVHIRNGKGVKTVIMKDDNTIHSDTAPLKKSEIKNIEKHKFMPDLFRKSLKKVRKGIKQKRMTKKKGSKK